MKCHLFEAKVLFIHIWVLMTWQTLKTVKYVLFLEYAKTQPVKNGFERPVIIHRAIFGSLERFIAILCEHTGGKWDFWVSPRQLQIIPLGKGQQEFA
jgi:threonyl-tRNA synthetase